jgi:outer membrane protein TolC
VKQIHFCCLNCIAETCRAPRWRLAALLGLCLALLVASSRAEAQVPRTLGPDLTLRQALDIALINSSVLREAQASLEQSSGQYEQARSSLLPQFGFAARQGYLTANLQGLGIDLPGFQNVLGPSGSMDARVFVAQDLLNIASLRSWRSYRSRQDASRLLVDNAREVVTLNVVGAYLQALNAKASRDTLTEQTKLATDLYQITAARSAQGVASQLDANRAKQQVNSLQQQLEEAEQGYVAAKLNLANLLQARITSDFDVSDQAAYGTGETVDRQATLQAALATRADYRAAQAAVRAAELEVKSIQATRLPTIQLRADDGQSGTTPTDNVNVYSVFGSITVPLFTSGRIAGQVRQAQGTLAEAKTTLDQNRSQIETDVLAAISGVEWALKQVQTSVENVGLSRQEVDLTRSRFVQGIADNTEVVNAQDRLSKANDARIRAQHTLGLARANLARAVGGAEQAYRK